MKRNIMLFMFVPGFVLCVLLILTKVFAQEYYLIGEGPISVIEYDNSINRLLVTSGTVLFIVNPVNGDIDEDYETEIAADDIIRGLPQDDFIYEIGSQEGCSINTQTSVINSYYMPDDFFPSYKILQDSEKLYVTCKDMNIGQPGLTDKIVVFNKADLSQEAIWLCEEFPKYAIYDYENNLIVIAAGMAHSHNPAGIPYIPAGPGIQWLSNIGWYDPLRQGNLITEVTVEGSISGLALMSDGTVVAGLTYKTANEEGAWASTLAIISDPIEYIGIGTYHVVAMDCDSANDRLICSLYDYEEESGGHILVWDYNTREYNIIEAGVSQLIIIKYMDGKLYASNSKDNKVYVIDID